MKNTDKARLEMLASMETEEKVLASMVTKEKVLASAETTQKLPDTVWVDVNFWHFLLFV